MKLFDSFFPPVDMLRGLSISELGCSAPFELLPNEVLNIAAVAAIYFTFAPGDYDVNLETPVCFKFLIFLILSIISYFLSGFLCLLERP
jgi:hypothetical protein